MAFIMSLYFMKCVFCTKLYTEDFIMRHYVGFSQIGSQMVISKTLSCDDIKYGNLFHVSSYLTTPVAVE